MQNSGSQLNDAVRDATNYNCQVVSVEETKKSFKAAARKCLPNKSAWYYTNKYVPITAWAPAYVRNIKEDLVADIIAGFTVAIMHIPQGTYTGILSYFLKFRG